MEGRVIVVYLVVLLIPVGVVWLLVKQEGK